MRKVKPILAALLLATAAFAQELPNAPEPQTRFWDRQQIVAFGVSSAARAADATYTCHLSQTPGWHEDWLPVQSCAGVIGWLAAGEAAQTGVQYLLYRSGHRKLARIVPWVSVAVSAAAMTRSYHNFHQ